MKLCIRILVVLFCLNAIVSCGSEKPQELSQVQQEYQPAPNDGYSVEQLRGKIVRDVTQIKQAKGSLTVTVECGESTEVGKLAYVQRWSSERPKQGVTAVAVDDQAINAYLDWSDQEDFAQNGGTFPWPNHRKNIVLIRTYVPEDFLRGQPDPPRHVVEGQDIGL